MPSRDVVLGRLSGKSGWECVLWHDGLGVVCGRCRSQGARRAKATAEDCGGGSVDEGNAPMTSGRSASSGLGTGSRTISLLFRRRQFRRWVSSSVPITDSRVLSMAIHFFNPTPMIECMGVPRLDDTAQSLSRCRGSMPITPCQQAIGSVSL